MNEKQKALGRETPSEPHQPVKESEELVTLRTENKRLAAKLDAIKLVVAECKPDLKSALESDESANPCIGCSLIDDGDVCHVRYCHVYSARKKDLNP